MTDNGTREAIGFLKAKVEGHDLHLQSISKDVKAIRSSLDAAKGGWKTLMVVGGIAGTAGAVITKISAWMNIVPK